MQIAADACPYGFHLLLPVALHPVHVESDDSACKQQKQNSTTYKSVANEYLFIQFLLRNKILFGLHQIEGILLLAEIVIHLQRHCFLGVFPTLNAVAVEDI